MTALHRRSRGLSHSRKIKASPLWDEYLRHRKPSAARRIPQPDITKGWLLLAEKAWGHLDIAEHLMRPAQYSESAIREQLREWWIAGYVQALSDVKRERQRMEDASYQASLGTITTQELAAISHVYDRQCGWR